jgi:hypothetical protein
MPSITLRPGRVPTYQKSRQTFSLTRILQTQRISFLKAALRRPQIGVFLRDP